MRFAHWRKDKVPISCSLRSTEMKLAFHAELEVPEDQLVGSFGPNRSEVVMLKRAVLYMASCLLMILVVAAPGQSQTTYHFHTEAVSPWANPTLKTAPVDAASTYSESQNLKNWATGQSDSRFKIFRSVAPSAAGIIPANSTVTFNVWMYKTASYGVVYPMLTLWTYDNGDLLTGNLVSLCSVTGSAAVSATQITKYQLMCTIPSAISVTSARAYRLDAGVTIGTTPGNHNTYVRIYYEGSPDGNYDSTVLIPQPVTPQITTLSTNSGTVGASVTINGSNFGSTQGSSTVKFYNNVTASPTSWSDTSMVTSVPAGATTGNVTVTA